MSYSFDDYLKEKNQSEEGSTGKSGTLSFDDYLAQRNATSNQEEKKPELQSTARQTLTQRQMANREKKLLESAMAPGISSGSAGYQAPQTLLQYQQTQRKQTLVQSVTSKLGMRRNVNGTESAEETGAFFGANFDGKDKTQQKQAIGDTLYLIEGYYTPRAQQKQQELLQGDTRNFGLQTAANWTMRDRDPEEAKELWDELQQQLAYVMYSGTYTESEAQSIADRTYQILGDYQEYVDDAQMQEAMQWAFGESSEGFMQEWRYQNGYSEYTTDHLPDRKKTTRESVPYRTTEELLEFLSEGRTGKAVSAEEARQDNDKMAAGLYLANKAMTAKEYDRFINDVNMMAQNGKLPKEIAQEWIAARRENGLNANMDGISAALNYIGTRGGGEVAVEGVDTGMELASHQILGVSGEALDQWITRGSGYLNEGIGALLTVMGFDEAGKTMIEKGREEQEYKNRRLTVEEQQIYNAQREYAEATSGVENKVVRWLDNFIPGLMASGIGMGASAVTGGTIQAGTSGFMSAFGNAAANGSRALNATQLDAAYRAMAYGIKNARLFSMAGNAALNTYGSISNDERLNEAEKTLYALADGAAEFFSEKLFDGNPLLDGEDAGLFTKWVYGLTDDGTFRSISGTWLDLMKERAFGAMAQKALTSKAMDLVGEGLEEIVSSVGMMAVDYAMYGKSDVTWESLGNDFASGLMLSMILSGGEAMVEQFGPVNSVGDYKKIKFFTQEQQADVNSAKKQMAIYMIEYLGGNEKLMRENGFSWDQAEKASGDFQRILQEYDQIRRYSSARQQVAGDREETEEAPSAESVAGLTKENVEKWTAGADGTLGDVDLKLFTWNTALLDAEETAQAWDSTSKAAVMAENWERIVSAAANTELLVSAAKINLDNALNLQAVQRTFEEDGEETEITRDAYDEKMALLQRVETEARDILSKFENPEQAVRELTGRTEETAQEAQTVQQTQTAPAAQAEQKTGEESNRNGKKKGENQRGTEILDDGGKRDEGVGAGEQTGAVAKSTGGQVAGSTGKEESDILRNAKADSRAESAKEIGVTGGSEEKSLYVLSDEEIDRSAAWKRVKQDAESRGENVILFAGDLKVYNASTGDYAKVEGIYQENNEEKATYYIKADKRSRSAEKIYKHERFHELVRTSPELWAELVTVLYEQYSEQEIAAMTARYAEAFDGIYGQITEEMTEDEAQEIAMRYLEEMFADAYADIQHARVKTSAAKKVLENRTDALQRAEQTKRATRDTRGATEKYALEEGFKDELQKWIDETPEDRRAYDGGWFIVGTTSDAMKSIGVRESKVYWRKYKIGMIMQDHPEMSVETLKSVPEILENPVIIIKSKTQKDSIVVFGDLMSSDGKKVMAAVNLSPIPTGGMNAEFALIASAYGRSESSVKNLLKDAEFLYLDKNKKRTDSWLMSLGQRLPSGQPVYGPIGSISYSDRNVNIRGIKISLEAVDVAGAADVVRENGDDSRYSIEDDVRALDSAYKKKMGEDDTPEGMAPDDEDVEDYHALPKAEKERRAAVARESTLKSRIKASENAIAGQRAGKAALRGIGALTATAEKRIDKRVELIRETLQIDRAALKKKQQARETEERQQKKKKKEAEIKEQKAKTAQKEARNDLLNLFSVKVGKRAETAEMIDGFLDKLVRSGTLTSEDRQELFDELLDRGEMFVEKGEYYSSIRSAVRNGRVYVPESVRTEFGDDWDAVRKKAWGNRIYLTNDKTDPGIDVWTDELAAVFGGQFDGNLDLKTQLETIIDLAEEGRAEKVTIAEMMRRNSDEYGWSVEEQLDELERKTDRILETFAEKADLEIRLRRESTRKLLEDQEYFRKKIEKMSRERMENEARNRVLKRIDRLRRYEKKASPKFKEMIHEAIKDIDTLARSFSPRGIEDIQELLDDYMKMREDLGEGFITSDEIEERLQRLTKTHIDDMGIDEVRELGEALTGMIKQIQNQNRMLSTARKEKISIFAGKAQREIEASKGRKRDGKPQSYMQSHLNGKSFFAMISGFANGALEELRQGLSNGEERMRQFQMRAMRIFDAFMGNKANQKWLKTAAGKDAVWQKVNVKGSYENITGTRRPVNEIELTPMMRISLLMHSRNDDNLRHIGQYIPDGNGGYELVGGGVTVPNKKLYQKGNMKEAYAKGEVIVMPPEVVKQIARSCTEQEKAFADLLVKYFDGLAKDSINEVSLVLDGWKRAAVQNYFPIQSDSAFIVTENELVKQDLSLQSKGFLKERTHKGQNPVFLMDASEVLFRSIDQVSKYYGLTLPIRDVKAVLNATYYQTDKSMQTETTGEKDLLRSKKVQEGWGSLNSGSVKKTLESKWGPSATEYINKLLADLQKSEHSRDALSGFLEALRGNYARAVISFNPSSVLKQMSSYPVAMSYLDAGSLVYGLAAKHGKNANAAVRNLERYSAVYWYRNQGNATMELRDAMAKREFGDKLPLGYGWTQKMDSAVTRRLLAACERQVQKDTKLAPGTQEEIDAGTDRYWTEVAKLFNKVVLNTQSNTSIMERPEMTRANSSNISRFLTMFRTDAYQQYNLLFEAKGRLQAAKDAFEEDRSAENKTRLSDAKKFAAKSVTGVIVGQAMAALITTLFGWARFRDKDFYDEEGEFQWDDFFKSAGDDFIEGLAGLIMGGDTLWSAVSALINDEKWYGPEVNALKTISDLIDQAISLGEKLKNANFREGRGFVHDFALSLGTATGIPAANVEKYLLAAAKWIAPEFAEAYENFWEEETKDSLANESPRLIEEAVGQIMDNRTEGTSDEAKEEIARMYKKGWTEAVPSGIPTTVSYTKEDGEDVEIELSAKQREQYRKTWRETVSGELDSLIASEDYQEADDEGKAAMIKRLYGYAADIAKNTVVPEKEVEKWVQQGENAVNDGVPLLEYIIFRVKLSGIDGKDENGKSIDSLAGQRSMELLESMGWTDAQEKNVYLDVLSDDKQRSKREETVEALEKAGLNWEQINDIVSMVGNNKDRMNAIVKLNVSETAKRTAMMVYATDTQKKVMRAAGKYGVKMEAYMEVINNADENENGSISQDEAYNYILPMDNTWMEKAYLWQMVTDGKEGKSNPFSTAGGYEFWYEAHKDDE